MSGVGCKVRPAHPCVWSPPCQSRSNNRSFTKHCQATAPRLPSSDMTSLFVTRTLQTLTMRCCCSCCSRYSLLYPVYTIEQTSSKRRAINTCILNTSAGSLLDHVNGVLHHSKGVAELIQFRPIVDYIHSSTDDARSSDRLATLTVDNMILISSKVLSVVKLHIRVEFRQAVH